MCKYGDGFYVILNRLAAINSIDDFYDILDIFVVVNLILVQVERKDISMYFLSIERCILCHENITKKIKKGKVHTRCSVFLIYTRIKLQNGPLQDSISF